MSVSAKTARDRLRVLHLAASAVLGAYVYSPWGGEPWFRLLTQVVVLPLVTLSGLWMWKGRKLVSWLKGDHGRLPTQAAEPAASTAVVAESAAE
jgi:hypothetical protein